VATATDPLFDPGAAASLMRQTFPAKEEFVLDGGLAIASVSLHRAGWVCRGWPEAAR
jgi:hypothetical protein